MPAVRDGKTRSGGRLALASQAGSLAIILREEFGVPFRVYEATTGKAIEVDDSRGELVALPLEPPASVAELAAQEGATVTVLPGGSFLLGLSFHDEGRPSLAAFGLLVSLTRTQNDSFQERARIEKWLHSVHERLRLASSRLMVRRRAPAEPARDSPTSASWEAILRLEHLLRRLRIDKEPSQNRKRILRAAADLLEVQSVAWVPARNDEPVAIEGDRLLSPWDFGQLCGLLAQSPDWEKTGYLIRNEVAGSDWASRFPNVANVLAIPVVERVPAGWLIALNKRAGQAPRAPSADAPDEASPAGPVNQRVLPVEVVPFRRVDAALLTPFAALLGFLSRASQRYNYLKNLLVGLTRALTSAIDAKDSYTYGHSERVARIAVELGRELGLQEDELSDIYLAGLLHDIGKIGIRDSVLHKRDALTHDEFEHIKEHVKIGYRILADLRPIAHLLPGVLYHHERFDGKGYPEGLNGNAIPFVARILAVADSYDAMSTSRPYRAALPPDRTEAILIEGSGSQWDKAVVDAFVRCKDRIHAIRQRGVGESLRNALDDALRKGTDRHEVSGLYAGRR
jgi:HD-GYP domain-containing protein (c-di-GMP phosphodiesterase class II)